MFFPSWSCRTIRMSMKDFDISVIFLLKFSSYRCCHTFQTPAQLSRQDATSCKIRCNSKRLKIFSGCNATCRPPQDVWNIQPRLSYFGINFALGREMVFVRQYKALDPWWKHEYFLGVSNLPSGLEIQQGKGYLKTNLLLSKQNICHRHKMPVIRPNVIILMSSFLQTTLDLYI